MADSATFRADHVGSLIRPRALLEARRRWALSAPDARRGLRILVQLLLVLWTFSALTALLEVLSSHSGTVRVPVRRSTP